jgi:succinoglycan biosynthesis protein ExoM
VNILIVDNDTNFSARSTADKLIAEFSGVFEIYYYEYTVKGLSNVRNELIRRGLLLNPDFLVFIDDDEYVTKEWISSLVETIINNNADAARGPVVAIAEEKCPDRIWCWFSRESYPDGSRIYSFTTGNLILRVTSLKKYNIWFDNRFNLTGFEDSYFGIQMIKKGSVIYWSDKSVAYESIPGNRTTLRWLMLRTYNSAITYTYMLKLEKEYLKLSKKIAVSTLYLIVGLLAFSFIPFPFKRRYWGLIKASEGVGGFAGLFNIKYYEYK